MSQHHSELSVKTAKLGRLLRQVKAARSGRPDPWPAHPALYELNTWTWLRRLGMDAGHPVTLGNVPDEELERIADRGFDAVWLMGVWLRSRWSRRRARGDAGLQARCRELLPDGHERDLVGSPYAVAAYRVDPALGGDGELAALRQRLAGRGLRLVLDFVPNHLAADHPWVAEHPHRLVQGNREDLSRSPDNWFRHRSGEAETVFAHGRDPNYPGWTDTVQLDYRVGETRTAMERCLLDIADRCDGVRCDMAMLPVRSVFQRTWGGHFDPPEAQFWPRAIDAVRRRHPGFLFIGEVYWDMEWELQQQGFDYTYDKRLYDLLLTDDARGARLRLNAEVEFQNRLTRFIENHDEQRAALAFGPRRLRAAAVVSLTLPGMRLFHDGQLEGRRLKSPVQLGRWPEEDLDGDLARFYARLTDALRHPVFRLGEWTPLEPQEEWFGNPSCRNIIAHRWALRGHRRVAVANLSPEPAQCFLPLQLPGLGGMNWRFEDLLGEAAYHREGDDLVMRGLYLDLPPYGCHLFDLHHADRPAEDH